MRYCFKFSLQMLLYIIYQCLHKCKVFRFAWVYFSFINTVNYSRWWFGIKTRTSLCLISLGWRTQSLFLCRTISLVIWTHEISLHKHNLCVLPRLIKHPPVLVIKSCTHIKYSLVVCLLQCPHIALCVDINFKLAWSVLHYLLSDRWDDINVM